MATCSLCCTLCEGIGDERSMTENQQYGLQQRSNSKTLQSVTRAKINGPDINFLMIYEWQAVKERDSAGFSACTFFSLVVFFILSINLIVRPTCMLYICMCCCCLSQDPLRLSFAMLKIVIGFGEKCIWLQSVFHKIWKADGLNRSSCRSSSRILDSNGTTQKCSVWNLHWKVVVDEFSFSFRTYSNLSFLICFRERKLH